MSDAWRCLLCLHADIPVFPTVTAVITLEKYEESISATNKFLVPRDYHKVSIIYTVKSAVLLVFFDLVHVLHGRAYYLILMDKLHTLAL